MDPSNSSNAQVHKTSLMRLLRVCLDPLFTSTESSYRVQPNLSLPSLLAPTRQVCRPTSRTKSRKGAAASPSSKPLQSVSVD